MLKKGICNKIIQDTMGCAKSNEQGAHACCPPGSWPALQVDYTPKGKTIDVGGVKVYEAGTGNKALVMFEDIFGIDSGKHKTIADTYAALGFRVYLPELLEPFYQGSIQNVQQIWKTCQSQKVESLKTKYEKLSAHIKAETGSVTFLAAAFCWGAWAAFRMSADYNNIRAIAAVHPSLNIENFYGGNEVKLVEAVKSPAFFYPCSNDQPGLKKGGEYVQILERKFGREKVGTEQFPNQQHGFIMRADASVQSAKVDTEKILKMSVEYFEKFA